MQFTKLLTLYAAAGAITLVAWILNVSQLYWMAGVLLLLPSACRLMSRQSSRVGRVSIAALAGLRCSVKGREEISGGMT